MTTPPKKKNWLKIGSATASIVVGISCMPAALGFINSATAACVAVGKIPARMTAVENRLADLESAVRQSGETNKANLATK